MLGGHPEARRLQSHDKGCGRIMQCSPSAVVQRIPYLLDVSGHHVRGLYAMDGATPFFK